MLTLLATFAFAGDDAYRERAKAYMDLSFDVDEVEAMIARPDAPAAAAPARGSRTPAVPLAALPLEPNSDVDSVVVFTDRAMVTRTITAEVPLGTSSLEFRGLPLGLASDSLEAVVRGGEVRIVGLELVSATPGDERARREALKREMRGLAGQLGEVRDRIQSLLAQRDYLHSALIQAPGSDRPMPSLDQVKGTLGWLGDSERDIATKLREQQEKAEEIGDKLQPLLVKLDNPIASGMVVRVDVEAKKATQANLGLRYQVFGASWSPSYNARLDAQKSHVSLEYFGIVSQRTGDDWKNATIRLSTADPARSGGELPALTTWTLGSGVANQLDNGRGVVETMVNRGPVTTAAPGGLVGGDMAAMDQGGGAVVFAIEGRRTIRGDGSETRIPIGTQTFTAAVDRASVPKLAPDVLRRARFVWQGQAPLLPGPVATFVGGDLVGKGNVGTIVPGEELRLGFGVDDQLKIERQLVERTIEHIGPGKKTTRYTFRFRIKVQNFGTEALEVLVTDQIPVSEIDRVEVTELAGTPAQPVSPEDPAGLRRWVVKVAPGTPQIIELAFTVEAPREYEAQLQQLEYAY